jgi:hypothetical protein
MHNCMLHVGKLCSRVIAPNDHISHVLHTYTSANGDLYVKTVVKRLSQNLLNTNLRRRAIVIESSHCGKVTSRNFRRRVFRTNVRVRVCRISDNKHLK